jgi:hypothetical protein
MKKPFEVGERVLAEWEDSSRGLIEVVRGIYRGLDERGFAAIECLDGLCLCVPRSLRRLVKKERRRVWVRIIDQKCSDPNMSITKYEACGFNFPESVEFIEVRKPKGKA